MSEINQNERPNILLINTDQQRGDCLSAEGHPVLLTPSMDGIAENGVRFTHFYTACPSCIAARRSILSGQSPKTHGMVGYRDRVEWDAPPTLPQVLGENGYQTRLIGRSMHQYPPRKRYGYDEMETNCHTGANDYGNWLKENAPSGSNGWFGSGVMHNDWTAHPWPLDEHLHFTNWSVSRTLQFMERLDPSCPFFLTLGFIAPHPPLQPPAFYFDRYMRTGVPEPVIGDWASPPETGDNSDPVAPNYINLQGEAMRSARAAYYGLINHVDDQLRRLLNGITGFRKYTNRETIIIFTSDHGEMLGDHHLWRKSRAYEAGARIPFLISAPERFGIKKASVVDAPCTHADIMPTLLDMVGIDIPDTVEGLSMLPLLQGKNPEWRDYLHIEHAPYHQCVTDGKEKFIWSPPDGKEQFFNLVDDPNECTELIGKTECSGQIDLWRDRLINELQDRPEGFTDDQKLIPGRPYNALLETT